MKTPEKTMITCFLLCALAAGIPGGIHAGVLGEFKESLESPAENGETAVSVCSNSGSGNGKRNGRGSRKENGKCSLRERRDPGREN